MAEYRAKPLFRKSVGSKAMYDDLIGCHSEVSSMEDDDSDGLSDDSSSSDELKAPEHAKNYKNFQKVRKEKIKINKERLIKRNNQRDTTIIETDFTLDECITIEGDVYNLTIAANISK